MATIPIPIPIPNMEKEEISTPEKLESDFQDEMELSAPHGWKKKKKVIFGRGMSGKTRGAHIMVIQTVQDECHRFQRHILEFYFSRIWSHRKIERKTDNMIKFTPKKGGMLRRNEIFFISPTGEEIRNKRQLEQYLKSHPGGPSSTEFNWGTGDTPRRSARINNKVKATETPEGEQAKKRGKKSSDSKEEDEEKGDRETEAPEDTEAAAATTEPKDIADAEMKEVDDGGKEVEDVATKEIGAKEASVEQKDEEEVDKNGENPQIIEINSDAKETEHKKLAEQNEKAEGGHSVESETPPPTSELVNGEAKSLKETEGEEGLPEKDIDNDMEPKSAEVQSSINGVDALHPPPVSC